MIKNRTPTLLVIKETLRRMTGSVLSFPISMLMSVIFKQLSLTGYRRVPASLVSYESVIVVILDTCNQMLPSTGGESHLLVSLIP